MDVCKICDGLIPRSVDRCPNCEATPGRASRLARRVLNGALGGTTAMTLMACYGSPGGYCEDQPDDCWGETETDSDGTTTGTATATATDSAGTGTATSGTGTTATTGTADTGTGDTGTGDTGTGDTGTGDTGTSTSTTG